MIPRERGFLLLTSHLGDPERRVLSYPQLRDLAAKAAAFPHGAAEGELSEAHLRQLGCEQWRLESGTYIAPNPLVFSDSLILLSRIQPGSPGVHVIEAELSDDNVSYAKMMMIAADAVKNRED